jgi:hypothetical protein
MKNLDKYNIITLASGEKYTIAEILDYNDTKYLYLIEVDEEEELLDNYRIVKAIKDVNNNYGIDDILDEKELSEIKEILLPLVEINSEQE